MINTKYNILDSAKSILDEIVLVSYVKEGKKVYAYGNSANMRLGNRFVPGLCDLTKEQMIEKLRCEIKRTKNRLLGRMNRPFSEHSQNARLEFYIDTYEKFIETMEEEE